MNCTQQKEFLRGKLDYQQVKEGLILEHNSASCFFQQSTQLLVINGFAEKKNFELTLTFPLQDAYHQKSNLYNTKMVCNIFLFVQVAI